MADERKTSGAINTRRPVYLSGTRLFDMGNPLFRGRNHRWTEPATVGLTCLGVLSIAVRRHDFAAIPRCEGPPGRKAHRIVDELYVTIAPECVDAGRMQAPGRLPRRVVWYEGTE